MKQNVCLIASSGGHFEQIMMLKKIEKDFNIFTVTEKTKYSNESDSDYFLMQINRKEILFPLKIIVVFFQSLIIFLKEKPDVVISTGALSVIPMFFISKICNKKLIFIESFAKVKSPTLTGRLLYKFVDVFIIQWKELLEFYPNAIYLGSIY